MKGVEGFGGGSDTTGTTSVGELKMEDGRYALPRPKLLAMFKEGGYDG